MLKLINLALYKSLINSDFILLNSNSIEKNAFLTNSVQSSLGPKISTLDVLALVKSCKQFIRLLQFLKLQRRPILDITVDNRQHYFLLKEYLFEFQLALKININFVSPSRNKKALGTQFHLLLGSSNFLSSKNLEKKLFLENNFLITKINSRVELKSNGSYKIYNDILDFKKIVFLIVLFDLLFTLK